jgi:hypothetical protein
LYHRLSLGCRSCHWHPGSSGESLQEHWECRVQWFQHSNHVSWPTPFQVFQNITQVWGK